MELKRFAIDLNGCNGPKVHIFAEGKSICGYGYYSLDEEKDAIPMIVPVKYEYATQIPDSSCWEYPYNIEYAVSPEYSGDLPNSFFNRLGNCCRCLEKEASFVQANSFQEGVEIYGKRFTFQQSKGNQHYFNGYSDWDAQDCQIHGDIPHDEHNLIPYVGCEGCDEAIEQLTLWQSSDNTVKMVGAKDVITTSNKITLKLTALFPEPIFECISVTGKGFNRWDLLQCIYAGYAYACNENEGFRENSDSFYDKHAQEIAAIFKMKRIDGLGEIVEINDEFPSVWIDCAIEEKKDFFVVYVST